MRIVSLVPAATEIAFALGAGDDVVAVTHDCDEPPRARTLPKITRAAIPPGASQRDIDRLVREAADRGETTFHLDAVALRAARPDVILGQTLCAVCAVTLAQVPASLPAPVPLEGASLAGILDDVARVGAALAREREAAALAAALRARLDAVAAAVTGRPRPGVVCLEWIDPLFNAGHWVPEQVAVAGGTDLLGRAGARSREIGWRDVAAARPDVLVVMPCGFDARRALADARALADQPGWGDLPAARTRRAFAVDGNAYFSRPGPRVVDGAELLASLLHPGAVAPPRGARAFPLV